LQAGTLHSLDSMQDSTAGRPRFEQRDEFGRTPSAANTSDLLQPSPIETAP
jgi:hypothetical protein